MRILKEIDYRLGYWRYKVRMRAFCGHYNTYEQWLYKIPMGGVPLSRQIWNKVLHWLKL